MFLALLLSVSLMQSAAGPDPASIHPDQQRTGATQENAASADVNIEQPVNLSRILGSNSSEQTEGGAPEADRAPMTSWSRFLLAVYCLLIVMGSLIGGWLPGGIQLTHTRMQTVISFVGGLMLGIGVFHLLPHAMQKLANAHLMSQWMMLGIVMTFAMIRLFHFHNHEPVTVPGHPVSVTCSHGHDHDHDHDSAEKPGADSQILVQLTQPTATGESHSAALCHSHGHAHGVSWMGIALGLSVHTFIDGLALAASTDSQRGPNVWLPGAATFLAILLHKPLDAVSITSLMLREGWGRRAINLVNGGFSMMCPLGAILFLVGLRQFSGYHQEILGTALAFSCGVFVCIALSDLLPEMEFHAHNKVQLTIALALGLGLSWAMTLLEPGAIP